MPLVMLLALGLVVVAFVVVVSRANELFLLSVREGEVLLVRGRIPVSLRQDIADVVKRAGVQRASLRAVRSQRSSRLVVHGVDEGTAQRLRNVFGVHPIQRLRAAPLPDRRNLGQVLGFVWLAWLLTDHR